MQVTLLGGQIGTNARLALQVAPPDGQTLNASGKIIQVINSIGKRENTTETH